MSDPFQIARNAARQHQDHAPLLALMPYARFLGVRMTERDGKPCSHLPFRPSLVGNRSIPALHGGVTAAFMENAALLHLLLAMDETRVPKSIDFAIDYLKPGRAEDTYADCDLSRAGQRVAHVTVRCWQRAPDQVIAIARGHFLLGATE